jgi:DNA-binding CsgD family transcriptional regulator
MAARLWGAAETLREDLHAPLPAVFRTEYERAVAATRIQVGDKLFTTAWTQGRAMTLEQVLTTQGQATSTELPSVPSARMTPLSSEGLTTREVEVLRLLARGFSNAQIAEELVVSLLTVKAHLRSIYSKFRTKRTALLLMTQLPLANDVFSCSSQYTTNSGARWTSKKPVVVGYPLRKGGLLLDLSVSSQAVHRFSSANLNTLEYGRQSGSLVTVSLRWARHACLQ